MQGVKSYVSTWNLCSAISVMVTLEATFARMKRDKRRLLLTIFLLWEASTILLNLILIRILCCNLFQTMPYFLCNLSMWINVIV